jgi:hypothetical protein
MRRMWVHHFNASLDNIPEFDPYGANGAYGIMKRRSAGKNPVSLRERCNRTVRDTQ